MKTNILDLKGLHNSNPPPETPIWVLQENGTVTIGASHNNGMGCGGIALCEVDFEKNVIRISNNTFLVKVTHWALVEDMEQIKKVYELE